MVLKNISAEKIYRDLLDNIISLKLEPGSLISENTMSNEYGVSRSVIRTVFARLNELGFIDIYPQRGSYVSLIDMEYIENLLILRTALEKEVIFDVMTVLNEEERKELLKKLDVNMKKQYVFKGSAYNKEYSDIDEEFHCLLFDSVKKAGVRNIIADMLLHISRFRNFNMAFVNTIDLLIDEHEKLLSAIKDGKIKLAMNVINTHLEYKVKIANTSIKEYLKFFVNVKE